MPERFRSASKSRLPVASVIDDQDTLNRVIALLKKGTANKVKQSELEEEDKQIRDELTAICTAYNLPGIRHGLNAFEYFGWQTRDTLSKERLLALGVPADTIAQAYVKGKPFLYTKLNPFDVE